MPLLLRLFSGAQVGRQPGLLALQCLELTPGPGKLRLGPQQLDQGTQAGGDLLGPGLVRCRLEGGRHVRHQHVGHRVVGLQEAGCLVLEHLVEGPA